jgi:hypothetical protein
MGRLDEIKYSFVPAQLEASRSRIFEENRSGLGEIMKEYILAAYDNPSTERRATKRDRPIHATAQRRQATAQR